MPCFKPLEAWRGRKSGPSGKGTIVFRKEDSCGIRIDLPCGQCIGCRLERSRQWAVRMMHEASLHQDNCFLTLTYDPQHLPGDLSLDKRHFQLFMKRFRKRCGKVRFFHCGEYGESSGRPHYHAIFFGFDFPDKEVYTERNGVRLYSSALLDELWGLGVCRIGAVSFESCAYVARYVMKKVTGDSAESFYSRVSLSGSVYSVLPEYCTMSRRPGIARQWFEEYGSEAYPSDEVISRGFPSRPPRYYDNLLEASEPEVFSVVKRKRVATAKERSLVCDRDGVAINAGAQRLRVREKCAEARVRVFKRPVD